MVSYQCPGVYQILVRALSLIPELETYLENGSGGEFTCPSLSHQAGKRLVETLELLWNTASRWLRRGWCARHLGSYMCRLSK